MSDYLDQYDYGCVTIGSAVNTSLKKLEHIHHQALRLSSVFLEQFQH